MSWVMCRRQTLVGLCLRLIKGDVALLELQASLIKRRIRGMVHTPNRGCG